METFSTKVLNRYSKSEPIGGLWKGAACQPFGRFVGTIGLSFPLAKEFTARLLLSKEEFVHLYRGGLFSEIKAEESDASVEISCWELAEKKDGTRNRFKTIEAQWATCSWTGSRRCEQLL